MNMRTYVRRFQIAAPSVEIEKGLYVDQSMKELSGTPSSQQISLAPRTKMKK